MITGKVSIYKHIMKTGGKFGLFIILLIFCTISCSGVNYRAQSPDHGISIAADTLEQAPSSKPEKSRKPAAFKKPDTREPDYFNYMMASVENSRGDYEAAAGYLSKVLKNDPESSLLNSRMALIMRNSGKPVEALKYAQNSLEINPYDTGTRLLLAELYTLMGDDEAARTQYEKMLDNDTENQQIRMIYAANLIHWGLFGTAMTQLEELIGQNPYNVIAHYYKARMHLEMNQIDVAEKGYLKALEIDDKMEPALFDLGSLYFIKGDVEKAAEIYEKLVDLYPYNHTAKERLLDIYRILGKEDYQDLILEELKNRYAPGDPNRQAVGLYYLREGRLEEAIFELDMIVTHQPEDYISRYYLAMAYERNGLSDLALHHFRLTGENTELYIGSRIHIAYILIDLGRYDEAIETIEGVLEVHREEVDLYIILSNIYESKGNLEKAGEVIGKGVKYDNNNIDLLYRLGGILYKSGDIDGAISQMRKIIEIDPDHADSMNFIGYTYAEKGIYLDEALDLIKRALEIKPDSGYIIDSLGWVYYQKGYYDKAVTYLKKAFSLMSEDSTVAEHLGDAYLKNNEYGMSLEMYETALDLDHEDADKIIEKIEEVKNLMK